MEPNKAYSAIVLDRDSRALLLRWWEATVGVPLLAQVVAHHVTLVYGLTPEAQGAVPIGQPCVVRVTGWAADYFGQAVAVEGPFESANAHPHVTLATAEDIEAVYSNELLAQGPIHDAPGPLLRGIINVEQG